MKPRTYQIIIAVLLVAVAVQFYREAKLRVQMEFRQGYAESVATRFDR